jgi:predicted amidohydrolase YtcJ
MRHFMIIFVVISLFVFIYPGCQSYMEEADLVLTNGKIYSVDESNHIHQAIAIKNGRIMAIGTTEDIKEHIKTNTVVINLEGKTAIPGFIESHAHLMSLGYSKLRLQLNQAKNWRELLVMVKETAGITQPGEWIRGRGWHQEKWDEAVNAIIEGYPVHKDLSSVSPNNPVYLTHASGHAIMTNKKAMELAGVDRSTPDPPGGRIVRDPRGNPTGVFLETAEELIYKKLSESQESQSKKDIEANDRRAFQASMDACLSNGITSFHDAGATFNRVDFYKKMADEKQLVIRLWVMLEEGNKNLQKHISKFKILNYGNYHLTVRAIKRYMDGALGARGAWLFAPYTDLHSSYGLPTTPLTEMEEVAKIARENGFQLCTHAIGDRGNHETLNIYEKYIKSAHGNKDLRWRIEHAQHLAPADVPRFKELGIIAAMQSVHCTSDGPWVPERLGNDRSDEGAYIWKKLITAGSTICNGTDAPVEEINTLANFYAAITRKLPDGSQFYPDQCMTREEALRSYTINGAYAAFEEDIKGSLSPGKLADLVILDHDIMTIPEDNILRTKIISTIIGGIIFNFGKEN